MGGHIPKTGMTHANPTYDGASSFSTICKVSDRQARKE